MKSASRDFGRSAAGVLAGSAPPEDAAGIDGGVAARAVFGVAKAGMIGIEVNDPHVNVV